MGGAAGAGLKTCRMGIHPPAETCTAPTIIRLLLVIPPGPTLQALSGAWVEAASYTGIDGSISSSYVPKSDEQKGHTVRNLSTTPATSFTNRSNVISLRCRVWSLICIWRSHESYPGHCDANHVLSQKLRRRKGKKKGGGGGGKLEGRGKCGTYGNADLG